MAPAEKPKICIRSFAGIAFLKAGKFFAEHPEKNLKL